MKKITTKLFRDSLSKYTTGITIISINDGDKFIGKTVNSFASLSLNPPLVLFSLDKNSSSVKTYKKTSFLGINILSKKQKQLSNHFSLSNPTWNDTKFFLSKNKVPLIKNCIVNLNCSKETLINQGDHVIFVCKVEDVLINKINNPLIYYQSKYI